MNDPTWMYRRAADGTLEAEIFAGGAARLGWVDSPAKVGVVDADPSDDGGTAMPDLEAMTKDEIEALVLARTGVDLDKRRSLAVLPEQARELILQESIPQELIPRGVDQ